MSIYRKFCVEEFDEKGRLIDFSLKVPEDFNFAYDVVDEIAKAEPDKTAIIWCNTEGEEHIFSFKDVAENSNRIANLLKREGIKKGDRVMLILKRHYEYWFTAIALHKLGAVMIPATHMLTESDMRYRIEKSGCTHIICTPNNEVPEKIRMAVSELGNNPLLWTVQKKAEGFRLLNEEAMKESSEFGERVANKAGDPMAFYFTSGTTGNPKAVIHSFTYPLYHIVTARYWQHAKDGGLHFTVAETGWAKSSWGKLYGQWLVGAAVMIYDFDNFDPKQLVSVINRYKVTSFCAPPTIYRYLVRKEIAEMPSLEHACTAGESLAPEVFKRFKEKTGLILLEGYGQTETALLMANFDEEDAVMSSLGIASPFYRIELRDKNNRQVAIGESGEICIVPKKKDCHVGILTGYLGNDEQYSQVLENGVYHTGDAAVMDENGRFWFRGRFDDIIKTGGFRVGPSEIENVLMEHPAVVECCVIGVPDSLRGQAIKAFVVLGKGFESSETMGLEIKNFCNRKLAEYKWIRNIEFALELPKTISGKIRKNVLRAQN